MLSKDADLNERNVEKEVRAELHDLNNVLTVILGRLELVARSRQLVESDRKEIEQLVGESERCFEIIRKTRELLRQASMKEAA